MRRRRSLTAWSPTARAQPRLDDATILAIFDQANTTDIIIGRVGAKRGSAEEVRALGRMVVTDHVAVQQMGRDLAKKLGVFPMLPDHDTGIEDAAKTIGLMQSKTGADFDRAYLSHRSSDTWRATCSRSSRWPRFWPC